MCQFTSLLTEHFDFIESSLSDLFLLSEKVITVICGSLVQSGGDKIRIDGITKYFTKEMVDAS